MRVVYEMRDRRALVRGPHSVEGLSRTLIDGEMYGTQSPAAGAGVCAQARPRRGRGRACRHANPLLHDDVGPLGARGRGAQELAAVRRHE